MKITSMELLTLLHKTDHSKSKLSLAERAVLSVIICHINYKLENGYEAWPSTDTIIQKTGLSNAGINKCRKSLIENGWMKVVSGRKAGVSNHYFVCADKIIDAAKESGVVHSDKIIAQTETIPKQKQHERNTKGLVQNTPELKQDAPSGEEIVFRKHHPSGKICHSQQEWDIETDRKRIDDNNSLEDCPF